MKIKYRLVKFEKALAFQVLEQDERFKRNDEELIFTAENGFTIKSVATIDINCFDNKLYLRGSNIENDFRVTLKYFDTNKERDEYFDKVNEALKDWSENWEGWKDEPQKAKTLNFDVFEL